jgi:hypothetical protein
MGQEDSGAFRVPRDEPAETAVAYNLATTVARDFNGEVARMFGSDDVRYQE